MKTNRPWSELKIQNRYWKTNLASLIARIPNTQVKPRTTRIAKLRLACVIPLVLRSEFTLFPEARRERKMRTNSTKLKRSISTIGRRKANRNGKPWRRQLNKINLEVAYINCQYIRWGKLLVQEIWSSHLHTLNFQDKILNI
jgi:hypothetical protein